MQRKMIEIREGSTRTYVEAFVEKVVNHDKTEDTYAVLSLLKRSKVFKLKNNDEDLYFYRVK